MHKAVSTVPTFEEQKNELNQSDDKQESESDDQAKIFFNKGFITN